MDEQVASLPVTQMSFHWPLSCLYWYLVMAELPGSFQFRVTCPSPGVAVKPVGAAGASVGVAPVTAWKPLPTEFTARSQKV